MTTPEIASRRSPARLPDLGDQGLPGARLANNAISVSLALLGALLTLALIASFMVSVSQSVSGDGVLEADSLWIVRATEGGVIERVLVRAGDSVRENQLIARLDTLQVASQVVDLKEQLNEINFQAERIRKEVSVSDARSSALIAQGRAGVSRAETNLRERMADFGIFGSPDSVARASTGRIHIAFDARAADLDMARASLALATADSASANFAVMEIEQLRPRIRRLQYQLLLASARLLRHEIRAPAAGVVLTEGLERLQGATIAPGAQLLEVARRDGWHARVALPEHEVPRVHVGDRAVVEIPALSRLVGRRLDGRVRYVGSQPYSADPAVPPPAAAPRGYLLVVELPHLPFVELDGRVLRRGYVVHAKVITRRARLSVIVTDYFREQFASLVR